MMKIPKEMENRYASILIEGIAAQEVKIKKITDDEVIGEYLDGDEVHINAAFIRAWWPDPKREKSHLAAIMRGKKGADAKRAKQMYSADL